MNLRERKNLHAVATVVPGEIDKSENCSGELRLRFEIMELLTKYPIPAALLTGDYTEYDLDDGMEEPAS